MTKKLDEAYIAYLERELNNALSPAKKTVSAEGFFDFFKKKQEQKKVDTVKKMDEAVQAIDALLDYLDKANTTDDLVIDTSGRQAEYLSSFSNYNDISDFLKSLNELAKAIKKQNNDLVQRLVKSIPLFKKYRKDYDDAALDAGLERLYHGFNLQHLNGYTKTESGDQWYKQKSHDHRIVVDVTAGDKWYGGEYDRGAKYDFHMKISLYTGITFFLKGNKTQLSLSADEAKRLKSQLEDVLPLVMQISDEKIDYSENQVEDVIYSLIEGSETESLDDVQKKKLEVLTNRLSNDIYGVLFNAVEDLESGSILFFNQLVRQLAK